MVPSFSQNLIPLPHTEMLSCPIKVLIWLHSTPVLEGTGIKGSLLVRSVLWIYFNKKMDESFENLPGVVVIVDDILVW